MISYNMCLSLPDLLHSVWWSLGPSTLLQMASFHSFFKGWVIVHCIYVSHLLYAWIHLKGRLLSERNQSRRWPSVYNARKGRAVGKEDRSVVARGWEKEDRMTQRAWGNFSGWWNHSASQMWRLHDFMHLLKPPEPLLFKRVSFTIWKSYLF